MSGKESFRSLPLLAELAELAELARRLKQRPPCSIPPIDNQKTPGLQYLDADCTKVRAPFADNRDSAKRILRR